MRRPASCVALTALLFSLFQAVPSAGAGIPVSLKQSGHCSAFAPADWIASSNPQSSTLDLWSSDRTMYAGWGVTQVNRAMQPYYGPMYGDAPTSTAFLTNLILKSQFSDAGGARFQSPQNFLGFSLRHFTSERTVGVVFYRTYPPLAAQTFVESFYVAIADRSLPKARRQIPLGVVTSIRCVTQLVPSSSDGGGSHGTKSGKKRPGCGGEGDLRGYNKELGTQWPHNSVGTNYLFDVSDWRDNGPQGPGYYAKAGNELQKLDLGRDDDC